jgi:hypothetical protein
VTFYVFFYAVVASTHFYLNFCCESQRCRAIVSRGSGEKGILDGVIIVKQSHAMPGRDRFAQIALHQRVAKTIENDEFGKLDALDLKEFFQKFLSRYLKMFCYIRQNIGKCSYL